MRLSRIQWEAGPCIAFYDEARVVPSPLAIRAFQAATGQTIDLPTGDDLLPWLPPLGQASSPAQQIADWLDQGHEVAGSLSLERTQFLVPIAKPNKIFLLAGNYAEHVIERGGIPAERLETFPYVFMKPASTTLTPSGQPIQIPKVSPDAIDWELELAVVIGKRCKGVSEAEALNYVAGYTIINDVTNRKFRPNPGRKKRDRDVFFDWLHGKWFDSFCPCGPCITSADAIPDPQTLGMKLTRNGNIQQNGNSGQMVFPVAAVIEFISAMTTLEPGDLISTGTPAGVGSATGTYLKPGDFMTGTIEKIGTLITPVIAEL